MTFPFHMHALTTCTQSSGWKSSPALYSARERCLSHISSRGTRQGKEWEASVPWSSPRRAAPVPLVRLPSWPAATGLPGRRAGLRPRALASAASLRLHGEAVSGAYARGLAPAGEGPRAATGRGRAPAWRPAVGVHGRGVERVPPHGPGGSGLHHSGGSLPSYPTRRERPASSDGEEAARSPRAEEEGRGSGGRPELSHDGPIPGSRFALYQRLDRQCPGNRTAEK
jgi:hypothetical protein